MIVTLINWLGNFSPWFIFRILITQLEAQGPMVSLTRHASATNALGPLDLQRGWVSVVGLKSDISSADPSLLEQGSWSLSASYSAPYYHWLPIEADHWAPVDCRGQPLFGVLWALGNESSYGASHVLRTVPPPTALPTVALHIVHAASHTRPPTTQWTGPEVGSTAQGHCTLCISFHQHQ